MRIRSLTILILVVGGLLVPCMLLTFLLAPQMVPTAIRIAEDFAWTTAIEQSLLYQGYDVREAQIIDEARPASARSVAVSLGDLRDGELVSASDLVEDVHYSIGQSLAEWPFAPSSVGEVALWVYPSEGRAYAVEAQASGLKAWAEGELDREDYLSMRQLGTNAPQELQEGN